MQRQFRRGGVGVIAAVLMAGCITQLPTTTPTNGKNKITRPAVKASATPLPSPSVLPSTSATPKPAPSPDRTASPGSPSPSPTLGSSPSPSPSASSSPSASPSPQVGTLAGRDQGLADGTGVAVKFDSPNGLDIDSNGNLYVADAGNHAIRKVTPGGVGTLLAGGTEGSADGTGAAAQFNTPYGLAVDGQGVVYVADTGNHRIRKITPGGVVTTLAGDGTAGFRDSAEGSPRFKSPFSLDLDAAGNLYVADAGNHRIRKVTPDGTVTTVAGGAPGYVDGTLAEARFFVPNDVAVNQSGILFVADYSNHCIRQINPTTGQVSTIAGSGTAGFKDGKGKDAQFNSPTGLALGPLEVIYVADNQNHRIRRIEAGGDVVTHAGSEPGFVEGALSSARFRGPTDLALDVGNTLFVADTDNHRIRQIR